MKIFSRFLSLKKTLEAGLKNNKISSSDIYLISHKGDALGLRKLKGVLSTLDKSIDLIQVSPASPAGSNIPTVKEFLKKPKQGNSAKNVKEAEKKPIKMKIIEMYSCIDEHDLNIKIEKIQLFLSKGHQVKVFIGKKPGKKSAIGLTRSAKDLSKSIISQLEGFKSKVDLETLHQVQVLFCPKKL